MSEGAHPENLCDTLSRNSLSVNRFSVFPCDSHDTFECLWPSRETGWGHVCDRNGSTPAGRQAARLGQPPAASVLPLAGTGHAEKALADEALRPVPSPLNRCSKGQRESPPVGTLLSVRRRTRETRERGQAVINDICGVLSIEGVSSEPGCVDSAATG